MEIKSLKNIKRNGSVFELYTRVIVDNNPFAVYSFPCTGRHDMRLDLVCYDIYNNLDNVDVLCAVNGIINPFTVQNGDVLFFVDEKDLDNVRSDAAVIDAIIDAVKTANRGKEHKLDQNRNADTMNRTNNERDKKLLPPNIVQTTNANIDYGEGVIILKPF